ncbi:hypothetical protein M3197_07555 [Sporosarcina aquimarina]|uniref:hypothetical protein n=1 Tax=Sporosarcina aquimarina TaxID=114975 RepID=UPI002040785A|nr:hypothetical protein [Sporosarcina aquimarina]MCM3757344.1 hypothetical protein [Sporosarcina aquimarina]
MKRLTVFFMISVVFVVTGCISDKSNKGEIEAELAQLVASEKTLPSNFDSTSNQTEIKGIQTELVKTKEVYKDSWKEFQLEGSIPEIDFETNDVLFVGMTESSSCPYILDSLKTNIEESQLAITFEPLDDVCTADLSPRNFVIAIDKKLSSELTSFRIVTEQKEITVPIVVKEIEYDG